MTGLILGEIPDGVTLDEYFNRGREKDIAKLRESLRVCKQQANNQADILESKNKALEYLVRIGNQGYSITRAEMEIKAASSDALYYLEQLRACELQLRVLLHGGVETDDEADDEKTTHPSSGESGSLGPPPSSAASTKDTRAGSNVTSKGTS
jgi:hypothetical protein